MGGVEEVVPTEEFVVRGEGGEAVVFKGVEGVERAGADQMGVAPEAGEAGGIEEAVAFALGAGGLGIGSGRTSTLPVSTGGWNRRRSAAR